MSRLQLSVALVPGVYGRMRLLQQLRVELLHRRKGADCKARFCWTVCKTKAFHQRDREYGCTQGCICRMQLTCHNKQHLPF